VQIYDITLLIPLGLKPDVYLFSTWPMHKSNLLCNKQYSKLQAQ